MILTVKDQEKGHRICSNGAGITYSSSSGRCKQDLDINHEILTLGWKVESENFNH